MQQYFGIIQIREISNDEAQPPMSGKEPVGFIPLEENHVRFVHYPDCQQLVIWLPQAGTEYGRMRLIDTLEKKAIGEWPVGDLLSGSIQVLWDTLDIAPGSYVVEIDWKNGRKHHITFDKYEDGFVPPLKQPVSAEVEQTSTGPVIYRDGFGNILENEDLLLREKVTRELNRKFSRQIRYTGTFRAGNIIYSDNLTEISFSHEMGMPPCMFSIDIPTEDDWEKQTHTPLSDRRDMLEFIAERVRAEQASNCTYQIKANMIAFYYKK